MSRLTFGRMLEYCKQLFLLMDSFWVKISGKRVGICWLVKVRGHLDKVEMEQQRFNPILHGLFYVGWFHRGRGGGGKNTPLINF